MEDVGKHTFRLKRRIVHLNWVVCYHEIVHNRKQYLVQNVDHSIEKILTSILLFFIVGLYDDWYNRLTKHNCWTKIKEARATGFMISFMICKSTVVVNQRENNHFLPSDVQYKKHYYLHEWRQEWLIKN